MRGLDRWTGDRNGGLIEFGNVDAWDGPYEMVQCKRALAPSGLPEMDYSLNPSLAEGFVRPLYPDSPHHPRQKYLLTVKGLAMYNNGI